MENPFVRFLQPEAADPNRRTYRRAPRRGRRRAALRSWLPTSCLRTTGVLDRREAGRPGCCYRPNPLAPIRVADYWIAAVDAKRCLLLLIRSGRAARLCKRVRAAAPTGQPEPGSPLVHSPTRRSPL